MHDDIILWRSQGYSWAQIAQKLKEEYGIEITKQSVYEYYKKHLEPKAKARLKELYDKQKGEEGATEKELLKHIEDLDFAVKRAKDALQQDWIIQKPHQLQAAVNAMCAAIKLKADLLMGQEEKQENPLIQLLKMRAEHGGSSGPI